MKFSDVERDDTQIELTPLIDVVFLLLIFFMVSTTFTKESALRIDLPESSEDTPPVEQPAVVEVLVSQAAEYAVKGPDATRAQALINSDRTTLMRALEPFRGREIVLVIRADRLAPHEAVVQVMDIAKSLDLTRLTFAARQLEENEGAP